MKSSRDEVWRSVYAAEVSRQIGERTASGRSLDQECMKRFHEEAEAAADWNAEIRETEAKG